MTLRRFVIERDIPKVGTFEREQLRSAAAKLIRWGTFRFDLVGRLPILAAVTLLAALVGVKILVF